MESLKISDIDLVNKKPTLPVKIQDSDKISPLLWIDISRKDVMYRVFVYTRKS